MKKDTRIVVYDNELRLEAYRFENILQPFPNHFHEYYVIGYMESGERNLSCKNKEYTLHAGNVIIFNPGDNHACVQSDEGTLDYRGINISKETMLDLAGEITGKRELPGFSKNVLNDEDVICCLRPLHDKIMKKIHDFEKEEQLLFLISLLIKRYSQPFEECVPACRKELEKACRFMEEHFARHISLDMICRHAGLSKSALLKVFKKEKGVTPYNYLENIRIGNARKLLETGVPPAEAALKTGFSDQSHFTNYFNRFTGLTPGVYREIFMHDQNKK